MQPFTIDATPGGVRLTVAGQDVPAGRVVLDAAAGQVPQVTVWPTGTVALEGEGVVHVAVDPSFEDVTAAAQDLIDHVDVQAFTQACQARLRGGERDPFAVALAVLKDAVR